MTHLIDEVPEPPPGKIEVAIPVGRLHMFHSNPSVNDFPGILGVRV